MLAPMKILLDLRLMEGEWSGISQYSLNMLFGIATFANNPGKHQFTLLFRTSTAFEKAALLFPFLKSDFFKIKFLDKDIYWLSNIFSLRRLLKSEKFDWYYTPQFFWPYGMLTTKVACTIHDIIPLTHSHLLPHSRKALLKPLFRFMTFLSLKCSDLVFVDSQGTLDALSQLFGKKALDQSRKLYPAVMPIQGLPLPKLPWNLSPEYLLYVGRQNPYKNLARLIQAFHGLKKQGYLGKLVIAGKIDARYPELQKLVQTLELKNHVRFTDFVDNATLATLYIHCRLVVQPSLIEGFGLTALEPFLYSKLCVASSAQALPEILGDAALYFDPKNTEDLESTLWKALKLEDPEKEKLLCAGEEQLKRFHPMRIAKEWVHLLESTSKK
jgi:glycosyltransferase involved in cell wall biosynthesis